ncbi:hypothetical protein K438DRAFT_1970497 [Mycena galopus ATCC 62051]|nr:hypothetical protein K438DRAFT_1970497 [Mycena galopus ATCC 62051]
MAQNHFMTSTLEALKKYFSRPLIKEYVPPNGSPSWGPVSYETFLQDLEHSTAYWVQTLGALSVKQNDVVGLWVKHSDLASI